MKFWLVLSPGRLRLFICIYLFIHPLVNGHLSSCQLGAIASSAAGNISGRAAREGMVRCISDDVYLAVAWLGRRGGECSAFISVMPKSLCQFTLLPVEHESSGCVSSLTALGIF